MYSTSEQRAFVDLSKKILAEDVSENQIDELRKVLVYHEWKYSIQNDPVISDFEYDMLFKKLSELESKFLVKSMQTSEVGSHLKSSTFEKVKHSRAMISLDNTYNAEDLRDFDGRVKRNL